MIAAKDVPFADLRRKPSLRICRSHGDRQVLLRDLRGRWRWEPVSYDGDCVVAMVGYQIVGRLCFKVSGRTLYSLGTWVRARYRRIGIASALWAAAIVWRKPRYVKMQCVTTEGLKLAARLRALSPNIRWAIDDQRKAIE